MSDSYGLQTTGFVKKDYEEIRASLQERVRQNIDSKIDFGEKSVFGPLIDLMAQAISEQWEGAQALYNSISPNTATGKQLDDNVALTGFKRLAATATIVNATIFGDEGIIIPSGSKAKQTEGEEEFQTEQDYTISVNNSIRIECSISTLADTTLYRLVINGTNIDYTSDSDATRQEIIDGLIAALIGTDEETAVEIVDNGDETFYIQTLDDDVTFTIAVSANLSIDTIGSYAQFVAVNKGALAIAAESLDEIVTPVSGWDSISNINQGITGRDTETDSQLRLRRPKSLQTIGAGTDAAIAANMQNEVEGVTSATVISNRTNATDGDGRPAKSFEAIVTGGDDEEIARKIFEVQPAGIESHGNTTVIFIDDEGVSQSVEFSRPTPKYLWIDIDVTLYPEEEFPSNGPDLIVSEVVNWAMGEYTVGKDVIRQRINIPIYRVPGVGSVDVTIDLTDDPGDTPSYVSTDLAVGANEQAVAAASRVTVVVV